MSVYGSGFDEAYGDYLDVAVYQQRALGTLSDLRDPRAIIALILANEGLAQPQEIVAEPRADAEITHVISPDTN